MTLATHWIYLDNNSRVVGTLYQSKPIDRSLDGAIPFEFPSNKDISHALYDAGSSSLVFDAEYDEFHAEQQRQQESEEPE